MYDMLVTFGDSWPFGDELNHENEKPYGKILSEYLKCKFINEAVSASSIDSMILQLKKFISESYTPNSKTCAIFFITSYHRALLFNQSSGHQRSIYPLENHKDNLVRNYFKYVHSDYLDRFRANVAILALQKICSEYNIDDRYLIGWLDPGFDYPGIDRKKIFPLSAIEILKGSPDHECSTNLQNEYFYPSKNHPKQLGHKKIAEYVLEQIKINDNTH